MAKHDYSKTERGETIAFWRSQLERAEKVWEVQEPKREELRQYTSEYEMRRLVGLSDYGPDADLAEQVDIFILPRFVDRIKAIGGDERPEVRLPRDLTGLDPKDPRREVTLGRVGEIQDRLVMRAMAQAGAPEEYEDGLGSICVDGITAFWWEMTGLPSAEEEMEARKGSGQITQEAQAGAHSPSRLQDHGELGRALSGAAGSVDPDAARMQFAATEGGESPIERVAMAGAAHIEMAEQEEKAVPLYWRDGKFRLKCTRYDYGKWFLMDSTVTRHRDIRWMARKIAMDLDEAKAFPGFYKSVREKLTIEPFDDPMARGSSDPMTSVTDRTGMSKDEKDEIDGRVCVWHILDKKYGREYFIPANDQVQEFLADRPAPNVDENGRSVLEPVGSYPGFFPVSLGWGKMPTRSDAQKLLGIPLAMPGLRGQKRLNALATFWFNAVKQASSGWNFVDGDMYDEYEETFRRNEGGVFPIDNGLSPKDNPPMVQFGWRPPPVELYQAINEAKMDMLADLSFPIADFTSQPIAKTATQEEIAQQSGDRDSFNIVRHMEVSYAISAHIAMSMIRSHFAPEDVDALIGPVERQQLYETWAVTGQAVELPEVDFAPKSRARNLSRSKLLLDLHERAKAEIDPLTGAPRVDTWNLLEEAYKTAGVGKPQKYELSEEQEIMLMKARMLAQAEMAAQQEGQSGQATSNGKTRDTEGKPRGRRERAGRRDSSRGRDRGERSGADLSSAARSSRSQG